MRAGLAGGDLLQEPGDRGGVAAVLARSGRELGGDAGDLDRKSVV